MAGHRRRSESEDSLTRTRRDLRLFIRPAGRTQIPKRLAYGRRHRRLGISACRSRYGPTPCPNRLTSTGKYGHSGDRSPIVGPPGSESEFRTRPAPIPDARDTTRPRSQSPRASQSSRSNQVSQAWTRQAVSGEFHRVCLCPSVFHRRSPRRLKRCVRAL